MLRAPGPARHTVLADWRGGCAVFVANSAIDHLSESLVWSAVSNRLTIQHAPDVVELAETQPDSLDPQLLT